MFLGQRSLVFVWGLRDTPTRSFRRVIVYGVQGSLIVEAGSFLERGHVCVNSFGRVKILPVGAVCLI